MCLNQFKIVIIVLTFTAVLFGAMPDEDAIPYNLARIKSMDEPGLWMGGVKQLLTISKDCEEGSGSLEVDLDLDKGQYRRIEHNFIDGTTDAGKYLHGLNIKSEDFTNIRTIKFACRTDIKNVRFIFRIWDRKAGWLEWDFTKSVETGKWSPVALAVPAETADKIDKSIIGGVLFEIRAETQPVNGKILFDDLRFEKEESSKLMPLDIPRPSSEFGGAIHSLPSPILAKKVHLQMHSHTQEYLNAGDAEGAINAIKKTFDRFRGMDVEILLNVGGFRMGVDPNKPEDAARVAKIRDGLLKTAAWCEKNKVPFYASVGAITPIVVKAPMMAEICDTAPNYCLGASMGEFSPEDNDQTQEVIDLLDVLKARNKKLLLFNQSCYWFGLMLPRADHFREPILTGKYKDVFIPMWENLLPVAQGLCFGGCLGFWESGAVSDWGVSVQSWGYTNLNYGLTDQQPGHIWLRTLVSSIAFGATYIEIEPTFPFFGQNLLPEDELRRFGDKVEQPWYEDTEEMKALRHFTQLVKHRALLPAVTPQDNLSINPVSLQVTPTEYSGQWGILERGVDVKINQSHCPTAWEMSCAVPKYDVFHNIYDSMHFYDQTLPVNAYGLLSILPPEANLKDKEIFKTDGKGLIIDGKWLEPVKSAPIFTKAFSDAASKLPFTAPNCTISVTKISDGDYQIVIMDPEERFCRTFKTELFTNLKGDFTAFDAVTSEKIAQKESSWPIEVPAGGIRIIRVKTK